MKYTIYTVKYKNMHYSRMIFIKKFNPQALQGQMTGHQIAIDILRKGAESLITSEGDLLSNSDEIQETVGEGKVDLGS